MITISNEQISANINFQGAELSSLKKLDTNTEYIWQADPSYWGRHSPVLFPIVGRLKDDEYIHNDLNYNLSQHGFARDMEFNLVRQEDAYVCLTLKSSSQTLMVYPFKFELLISYELIDSKLEITYEVINKDHHDLLFSIGAHPAFNCPLFENEDRSEYSLLFSSQETASKQLLENGIRSGRTANVLQGEREITLSDDLFDEDALVFEDLTSSMITLKKGNMKVLSVHFEGFPYLGIWSKNRDSRFVCIEPWQGIADNATHNHQLSEKEGIHRLAPSGSFSCKFLIEIH